MCLAIYISPAFKFSLCWSLPTPVIPAPAVSTSYELCSPCLVDFKALPIRCKDAQLVQWLLRPCAGERLEGCHALKGILVPLSAAQRRLRAPCPGTGTGAAAQRDCKQSGPDWTARLLLLCFLCRSKGQKVILLLTVCAKFSGKQPRAAERWLLSLALAGMRHFRPIVFCFLMEIRSKPQFPRCWTELERERNKVTFPQGLWVCTCILTCNPKSHLFV